MFFGESSIKEAGGTFLPMVGSIDPDDADWKRLNAQKLDMPPEILDRSRRYSYYLYLTNPLAKRLIDLQTAFVAGGDVSIIAEDAEVQAWVDKFWHDKMNNWKMLLPTRVSQLALYGEWVMPVGVQKSTGYTRVGFVNPMDVRDVITDPSNVEDAIKIHVSPTKSSLSLPSEFISMDVVRPIDKLRSKHFGRLNGQVFFFSINKASDAARGTPDLLSHLDFLSQYDTMLYNIKERATHLNSWLWDVLLTDAGETDIQAFLKDFASNPPKPGSVRAHNQKVSWSQIKPELAGTDMVDLTQLFKMHIVGNFGFPEHFTGSSANGRGMGAATEEPTFKTLQARQDIIRHIIEYIIQFVIDQRSMVDADFARKNQNFIISMPRLTIRDAARVGGAVQRISDALDTAQRNEWLSKEECRTVFLMIADLLGVGRELREKKGELPSG